MAEGKV
jgi:hypothetical protein